MNNTENNENFYHFILKPGEMLLKSKPVRRKFYYRLIHNTWDAIRQSGCDTRGTKVVREQGVVSVQSRDRAIQNTLRRVFGVTAVALVRRMQTGELSEIVNAGLEHFKTVVVGKKFAVRCKRSGKTPFASRDVEVALGAALYPLSAGVDLSHPEIVCRLDVHDKEIKFYTDEQAAYGGLPIGTQGKAVALISGGIDSPVAAWYGLKRGLEVHYLFCSLGGPMQHWGPTASSWILANRWSYGYEPQIHIADFNNLLLAFKDVDSRFRNILLKRYLYRAADKLADKIGADAIITGEALGQVSSQTLSNLRTINDVTDRLIMRPLIGFDKPEIIARAREIGSLEISEKVPEFCNIAVNKPRTASTINELNELETHLDSDIAREAVSQWDSAYLRRIPQPSQPSDPCMESPPPGAWIVWIENSQLKETPPENLNICESVDVLQIRRYINSYQRPGVLLFVCGLGKMSRDAALFAREKGLDAYRYKNQ